MSNDKQIKLYTEEQVNEAMLLYLQGYPRIAIFSNHLTPIELPTDKVIARRAERSIDKDSFIDGAHWLKDYIKEEIK